MPKSAQVFLDTNRVIGEISPLLFGGFAEHLGRCIYEGIYDPASFQANSQGLRTDILAALREINYRIIRYPGGNFVSVYNWLDGVGTKEKRPRVRELAWKSIETNQFGTNEFIDFCRSIEAQPMLAINLGTGSIQDAANLVEYCNSPIGTTFSDLRAEHGYTEPHNVRYWCLGNEMDGTWQIGQLEAKEYSLKAIEAAKLMRILDPSIELIVCGSSSSVMPSFPEWDRIVLENTWEKINYLSMHYYAENKPHDTPSFLSMSAQFESQVDTLAATLRFVKAKLRSSHNVYLSWDEWNVWYRDTSPDGEWQQAPHLLEEVYNLEDALVVAQWLSVFLRKCDILKIACIAQIVNAIAPILTNSNTLLKQSIYYPLMQFSQCASGVSLQLQVNTPKYETTRFGEMPLLDVSSSYDQRSATGAIFLVNRSLEESLETTIFFQNLVPKEITAVWQMSGVDPKASNSFENPNMIVPIAINGITVENSGVQIKLPALSFITLTLKY